MAFVGLKKTSGLRNAQSQSIRDVTVLNLFLRDSLLLIGVRLIHDFLRTGCSLAGQGED